MKTNLAAASTIQKCILEEFYKAWQFRPDKTDYFLVDQVMDKVKARYAGKFDDYLLQGSFNDLLNQEYIEAKESDNGIIARITNKGRDKVDHIKNEARTRKIALTGAITGTSALLLSIIKALTD